MFRCIRFSPLTPRQQGCYDPHRATRSALASGRGVQARPTLWASRTKSAPRTAWDVVPGLIVADRRIAAVSRLYRPLSPHRLTLRFDATDARRHLQRLSQQRCFGPDRAERSGLAGGCP
jgi:hypothetical protein